MVSIAKSPEVLSSEILMKSGGYKGWFILLEGDFDQRFWGSRFNSKQLRAINCIGKPNVIGTLDLLISRDQANNIVALADKDYDELLARLARRDRLVYTDENDLEVTLLCCQLDDMQPAIERILTASLDQDRLRSFKAAKGYSVVECVRKTAASFGVLRLINEKLQLGVSFKRLPIRHEKYFDNSNLQLNQLLLQKIFVDEAKRAAKVPLTVDQLKREIALHVKSDLLSGWALVQGHDLIQLLASALNSKELRSSAKHIQANENTLARDLCLVIQEANLRTTTMFQKLNQVGNSEGLQFFP